jgi:hypothetical protein
VDDAAPVAPDPNRPPGARYEHDDGRLCRWEPYWFGNPRDGHERWGYWFVGPDSLRRWCGREHPDA